MERQPRQAPARRTFVWIGTSARKISFMRARCSNAGQSGGAERARQVVMGDGKHLRTGYQPSQSAPPSGLGPSLSAHRRVGRWTSDDWTTRGVRTAVDRGGGRVVRVSGGDSRPVRRSLQGGRALGLGAAFPAPAGDQDASRQAEAGGRSGLTYLAANGAVRARGRESTTGSRPRSDSRSSTILRR